MKSGILLLMIINITYSITFGQNPKLKRVTEIVYSYSNMNLIDGVMAYSKKGHVQADTIIYEYNMDGNLKEQDQNPPTTSYYLGTMDTLYWDDTTRHLRYDSSDSTFVDLFWKNYGDSIIVTRISANDTVEINKSFFHKGRLIKSQELYLKDNFGKYNKIRLYDHKSKNRAFVTIISTKFKGGLSDTTWLNNKKKIHKKIVFNEYNNECYVKEKIKYRNRKKIFWETFYNNAQKMYFTTKITTRYNKMQLPVSIINYDTYMHQVETKTVYFYEYY